ncbi:MAG TPA: EamA family transporter [Bryobacteraceae bacterium]|jgi:undecaprenyl phosphate-alpha-L-ara4N flippase subunit ArnE|nr:EamA family transporter [Bryobacteraceae bacterium]
MLGLERDVALDTSIVGLEMPMGAVGRSKFKTFLLAFVVVMFNALGNLFLAWGMKHSAEPVGLNPLGYVRAMLSPFVAAGIALLILWLLTRMALMSWADLTFALPLTGLGYVLAAVFGKVFLNESVSAKHWIGTLLIFAGVAVIGTTTHQTGLRDNTV